MAVTTKLLRLRPHLRRPFSSSSSSDDPSKSFSSYFSDVKASLNKQPPPPPPKRPFYPSYNPNPPPKISSSAEIHKNLSEFRRLSASPPPSFEQLYKRNVLPKSPQDPNTVASFSAIRESLKHLQSKNPGIIGSNQFNDSFFNPLDSKKSGGFLLGGEGGEPLPLSIFGKEIKVDGRGEGDEALEGELLVGYNYEDLGKKLMNLRPEKKKDERNWFSLQELSERLQKLRVNDKKEMNSAPKNLFTEIRSSLVKWDISDKIKNKKKNNVNVQRIDMLNNIGAEQDFMLSPPKEHLVEKYFHPDNMSSAEKLKIELKKVRDEFKMSESDCGSARVQVAQLTTKIKHLSTALHKKDNHSRKGLQAMVQRRKKLLKYLRRTDWDSYCLVLSKLGLRDNPDYKN